MKAVLQAGDRPLARQMAAGPGRPDVLLRLPKPRDYSFALALYLDGAETHLTKIGRWDRRRLNSTMSATMTAARLPRRSPPNVCVPSDCMRPAGERTVTHFRLPELRCSVTNY